jgi:hypothetical protein
VELYLRIPVQPQGHIFVFFFNVSISSAAAGSENVESIGRGKNLFFPLTLRFVDVRC